ncbi:hypothetical protein ACFCV8_19090 [Streptomyces sp. NPDC056347]|uniref:Rv1733c family protein n=1 Tax=Streptomyces sp. NPDC056347 TaxID=3345790 RepID=UPI0035DBB703
MTGHGRPGRRFGPSGRVDGRAAVVLVLTLALLCGAVAAWALWSTAARADRARAEHLHRVTATTTGPAVPTGDTVRPGSVAPAVWAYPGHVRRSGTVDVPPGTPRGRAVPIRVDAAGVPVRAPDSEAERVLTSFSGGAAAAGTAGAAVAGVLILVRRRAEARGFAALEREWEQVEPVWSGRLRRGSGSGADDDCDG